jgi:hypothetical protein
MCTGLKENRILYLRERDSYLECKTKDKFSVTQRTYEIGSVDKGRTFSLHGEVVNKSNGTIRLMTIIARCEYIFFGLINKESSESIIIVVVIFSTGAIFEQGSDEVQTAFKLAVFKHNQNNTERRFELQAYVDVIKTADAFKLSKLSEFFF